MVMKMSNTFMVMPMAMMNIFSDFVFMNMVVMFVIVAVAMFVV